jgi:hypothetical protein
MITSIQGPSFQNRVLPNPKISLPIFDELKELGYGKPSEFCEIEGARAMDSLQG